MKTLIQSLLLLLVLTILTGMIYPMLITGIAQLAFPKQANGSLVTINGKVAGSELIGQSFTEAKYFHGRPSAGGYDATNSGGFNLGPASSNLIEAVSGRIADIRRIEGLDMKTAIPPDMVLASASGLDPDISVENALLQVKRIAKARNENEEKIVELIQSRKTAVKYGFWGEEKVNVLKLNLALEGK